MSIRIFRSRSTCPFFNLAFEEWLWTTHLPQTSSLFLWQNRTCVIIGRYQNPHQECYLSRMEADDVLLVRRKSGGGAVYEDFGNSIFSFIGPVGKASGDENDAKAANNNVLTRALSRTGVPGVQARGRNDLELDGKKVSGSAFQKDVRRSLLLHHGTMLLDVDTNALSRYLSPDKEKLKSKAIKSVSSRVLNLSDINAKLTHDVWCNVMETEYRQMHGQRVEAAIDVYKQQWLDEQPQIAQSYADMKDVSWRYGRTPAFEHVLRHRFSWGMLDLQLNVAQGGVIEDMVIFSDALYPALVQTLRDHLIGTPYNQVSVLEAVAATKQVLTLKNEQAAAGLVDDVHNWLKEELT